MARRFDLWNRLRQLPGLDPRRDGKRGYGPEVIVGQLIYALCSGGGCLSDSEALNDDPLARELFGVQKFADQTQVGEWLREQSDESVAALRRLLHAFVAWLWQQAEPRRLLHAGQGEVFFDDTQLEVSGRKFEGAAVNYNGDLALSWQTLWVGPLLADGHVGSPKDVSDQLRPMLERHRALWQGTAAHFYADSGSSAGHYLDAIAAEGWHYTVSYNKWTGPLERKAQELPAWAWQATDDAQHAWLRHQPEGRSAPQLYAVRRRRDGLFDRYGFVACDDAQSDAALVGGRHRLKGAKEQLFGEVLNGLDLHRPPCSALLANRVYYLIAALAYDLLVAIKLLDLSDDCQGWRIKTLMKKLVMLPGRLSRRARQWVARVRVAALGAAGLARTRAGPPPAGRRHGLKPLPSFRPRRRSNARRRGGALSGGAAGAGSAGNPLRPAALGDPLRLPACPENARHTQGKAAQRQPEPIVRIRVFTCQLRYMIDVNNLMR